MSNETETITEKNHRVIKDQIYIIKKALEQESLRNYDLIKALVKRQSEIQYQWESFSGKLEVIGEFELESEYKFLLEIERNCECCNALYDKRQGSVKLCPACFTSNV